MQLNKSIALNIAILLIYTTSSAQSFKHPYSYLGIGELQEKTFYINSSLGGLSLGWNDKFSFTPANPASLSNIKFTSFDVGLKSKIQKLIQGNSDYTNTYTSFGYFGLGFPVNRKGWGACFGLQPVSIIGYEDSYNINSDSINKTELYDNQGGVSKFFIGNSFQLAKILNVGFNVAYLFGNSTKNHSFEFEEDSDYLSFKRETERYFGSLAFDIGSQLKTKVRNFNLTIGTVLSLPTNFEVEEKMVSFTYEHAGTGIYLKDSLEFVENTINSMHLPLKYGIGIMLDSTDRWKLGLDFNYEKWSEFKDTEQTFELNDLWEIIIGGELIPENKSINQYHKRIAYRFGIKYVHSYIKIDDNDLSKASISLGAGFPVAKSSGSINLGIETGKYIVTDENMIQESFINIFIGFRLNDIWFTKAKIE